MSASFEYDSCNGKLDAGKCDCQWSQHDLKDCVDEEGKGICPDCDHDVFVHFCVLGNQPCSKTSADGCRCLRNHDWFKKKYENQSLFKLLCACSHFVGRHCKETKQLGFIDTTSTLPTPLVLVDNILDTSFSPIRANKKSNINKTPEGVQLQIGHNEADISFNAREETVGSAADGSTRVKRLSRSVIHESTSAVDTATVNTSKSYSNDSTDSSCVFLEKNSTVGKTIISDLKKVKHDSPFYWTKNVESHLNRCSDKDITKLISNSAIDISSVSSKIAAVYDNIKTLVCQYAQRIEAPGFLKSTKNGFKLETQSTFAILVFLGYEASDRLRKTVSDNIILVGHYLNEIKKSAFCQIDKLEKLKINYSQHSVCQKFVEQVIDPIPDELDKELRDLKVYMKELQHRSKEKQTLLRGVSNAVPLSGTNIASPGRNTSNSNRSQSSSSKLSKYAYHNM